VSVEHDIAAIHARLAALKSQPVTEPSSVAQELGLIRAQLHVLAQSNEEVGQRLGEMLGLRQSRSD